MALINPCNLALIATNTGSECSSAMKATAMLFIVPRGARWTTTDIAGNFTTFIQNKIHTSLANRWYPVFGSAAPVRAISDANESDVLETMEDGSMMFIRNGMYNRSFSATDGGLCLGQSLMAINGQAAFVEVDNTGQLLCMMNADGTFSGVPLNLGYGPSPELANLKTAYKNKFYISFTPNNYIKKGKIFSGDSTEDILSLRGLYDTTIYEAATHVNAGATAATGTVTITGIGVDGNTIDVKVNGTSISGGPVIKTSAESSVTLLAAKISTAINAATATNGGYTSSPAVGVITITAPAGLGATINTISATTVIIGSITNTAAAFSGGVTGTSVLKLGIKTECAETDLATLYGTTLAALTNFVITKAGVVITPSGIVYTAGTPGRIDITIPWVNGTYIVTGAQASVLQAAAIIGYDLLNYATVVLP